MSVTVATQPSDVVERQARDAARADAERQTAQRASSKGWPQAALQEFEWQVGGKLPRAQQQTFRATYADEYPRALATFLAAAAPRTVAGLGHPQMGRDRATGRSAWAVVRGA